MKINLGLCGLIYHRSWIFFFVNNFIEAIQLNSKNPLSQLNGGRYFITKATNKKRKRKREKTFVWFLLTKAYDKVPREVM